MHSVTRLLKKIFHRLPTGVKSFIIKQRISRREKNKNSALKSVGLHGLAQLDFNHVLHYLRGEELKQLPKGVQTFISVGCAGTWYFNWIDECCGPITRHVGIEYYSPKPDDLPSGVEWIANTAGDMSSIDNGVGDILFSGQNIEHLWPEDVTAFLQESWRVLKVGGLLVMDSPNRLMTKSLTWSHPEHTIELTPAEARKLVEANGFEVTKLCGMWLCASADQQVIVPLDDFRANGPWSVKRRITDGVTRSNESFCWWLEARKLDRLPKATISSTAIMTSFFSQAWPERVNRFLTQTGTPCEIDGGQWFHSRGTAGALMYGPYMPLPTGDYTVTIKLKLMKKSNHTGSSLARIDVVDGAGNELIVNEIYAEEFQVSAILSKTLHFHLSKMTFGIQFRVISHESAHVAALKKVNLESHTDHRYSVLSF